MKLSKALLGAVLVGITAQTTGCTKGGEPTPTGEKVAKENNKKAPIACPGCGMG